MTHYLDLASMQFGEWGRGLAGEPFRLESVDELQEGWERFCSGWSIDVVEPSSFASIAAALPQEEEAWVQACAVNIQSLMESPEARWCGYCGASGPSARCGACREVYFCGKSHQEMGWRWHRVWCRGRKGKGVKVVES